MSSNKDLKSDLANTMKELNDALLCLTSFDKAPILNSEETRKQQIANTSQKIKQHQADIDKTLSEISASFTNDIEREVRREMSTESAKDKLRDFVRSEITQQVKEQVEVQIRGEEFLPVSLQELVEETRRQIGDVKISLGNSQARIQNSYIQTPNVYDPLAPILTATGERSKFYPANMISLFNYDETARELNRDYELTESDDLKMNFRQFLKHIGTNVEVGEEGV